MFLIDLDCVHFLDENTLVFKAPIIPYSMPTKICI